MRHTDEPTALCCKIWNLINHHHPGDVLCNSFPQVPQPPLGLLYSDEQITGLPLVSSSSPQLEGAPQKANSVYDLEPPGASQPPSTFLAIEVTVRSPGAPAKQRS